MNIEPYILFEDKYIIVIDKPAGLQVERDKFGHPSLEEEVQNYLEKYHHTRGRANSQWLFEPVCVYAESMSSFKKQKYSANNHYVGIVHRLDRPVCGVIILAKTLATLKLLQIQMQEDSWEKIYRALVIGTMPAAMGKLENYIFKDPKQKKAIIVEDDYSGAKKSLLRYAVLEEKEGKSLLEIQLITGRYHQIRAQLGHLGNPVIGDKLYGSAFALENTILLQSYSLGFRHPKTGEEMQMTTKTPLQMI